MKTRYRILIVDDEDNVRRMLTTAFSLQGHETHCASNGEEALQQFADVPPDVVLMDIRMPEMNGLDALKAMRARQPRIPRYFDDGICRSRNRSRSAAQRRV